MNTNTAHSPNTTSHRDIRGASLFESPFGEIGKRRRKGAACTDSSCTHQTLDCANTESRYAMWKNGGKP